MPGVLQDLARHDVPGAPMSEAGMSSMLHILRELSTMDRPRCKRRVTDSEYRAWQRHYTWDALKGTRYGQSFCDHFQIRDNILSNYRSVPYAERHIRNHYLDDRR